MKAFIITLLVDSAIAACWYFGKIEGIDGLLNIALGYMWFSAVLGIMCMAIKSEDLFSSGAYMNPLSILVDVLFTAAAVFYGHFFLAALYAIACLSFFYKKADIDGNKESK